MGRRTGRTQSSKVEVRKKAQEPTMTPLMRAQALRMMGRRTMVQERTMVLAKTARQTRVPVEMKQPPKMVLVLVRRMVLETMVLRTREQVPMMAPQRMEQHPRR